jgi:hypothetical protein
MGEQSRERFYAFWSDAFGLRQDPREKKPRERLPERDALRVPLPDDNKSLRVLAREAAEGLPSVPPGPERLHALRALVRMPETAAAKLLEVSTQARRGIEARVLDVVLPVRRGRAVTLSGPAPKGRAIVLVDEGRARGARVARRLLDDGKAVTLFDPLFVGESRVPTHDWTWAILVSAVGERPLGLQVAEIIALARALRAETGEVPTLTAVGPRTSLMALVAAALAKDDVAGVELTDPLETLHALPVETLMPQQAPELYTFGLLSKLDVGDIAALVAPRPVHVTSGLPDRWAQRAP